ncbi:uncharacterized protein [Musca autumnalis]|uniref:uncharacterized protein n=1 Tax=Musca autumnalis TaxID=221902 RepID=UPI003CE824DB
MTSSNRLTSLLIFSFIILTLSSTVIADRCSANRKCSSFEQTVYAVDNHRCYTFRNPCLFSLEQCRRKDNKESDLKIVSKQVCMKKIRADHVKCKIKMISSKILTSLFLFSFIILILSTTARADICSINRKCSTNEEIVYAVDNHRCYLFRNPCLFSIEQCRRKDKKQSDLKIVSKEICLKKCSDICTEEYAPVCAEYNGALKTFPNRCDFYSYSCKNNKSYMFIDDGECRA